MLKQFPSLSFLFSFSNKLADNNLMKIISLLRPEEGVCWPEEVGEERVEFCEADKPHVAWYEHLRIAFLYDQNENLERKNRFHPTFWPLQEKQPKRTAQRQ
ncbi:hypothetical protein CIPAW_07G141100 [Carya illinoinensis]|uniref:Uncharacterized protein n=1 Tax=Carya illinoinensis TaxID=32201 RepID=A0A8T1PYY1_CARIL|nr:hypothetical protein CIPAW_07G141100 [Carya illinoinensis]